MTDPVGPIFAGGFEHVRAGEYELLFLPDLKNDLLQKEGKPAVYYWMPAGIRLARENVDTGPFKFFMLHFVGVQQPDTTIGVTEEKRETSGGVITFTTTAAPPAQQLEAATKSLLDIYRGSDDRYWGWRTAVAPAFRPMPILSAVTSLTNLAPQANGATPASTPPRGPGGPRGMRLAPSARPMTAPRTVREGASISSNLDPWFIELQGQGQGNINLLGETAYSGLMGSMPAAILWESFHGGTGAIVARQDYKLKFWAPLVEITIRGHWDRIFEHFSAAASGHYLWASADIQVELNNMRTNGTIDVSIQIDPTIPGAEKMQEDIDKKTDLVLQKFMDAAQKMIFEPPPPKVDPAQASGGWGPWGVGFALKYRRDETSLELNYHERREMAYIQNQTVSSSLRGFADEIKADPDAEKRYFSTLYLDNWDRKLTRTIKPIVNWPDPASKWAGQPVAFLSAQVGYPDVNGALQWSGRMFQATDPAGDVFKPEMAQKKQSDVANPPAGWKPDITYVKRKVHFAEPPDETSAPNVHIFIEQQEVDLDPGENGTPTNEINLEVRADSAGKLDVGPISLNVELENSKQNVEVSFQCLGNRLDGQPRNITKFLWQYSDQAEARYWAIYTGQLDFVPRFRYQVRVVIKGSLSTKGMEWTGPWVETNGNGPLIISVPTAEDEGVTVTRSFPLAGGATSGSEGHANGQGNGTVPAGQPPATNPGVTQPGGNGTPAGQPPGAKGGGQNPAGQPPARPGKKEGPPGVMASGYKTLPDNGGQAGAKAMPAKGMIATAAPAPEPVSQGWTTEDPSAKRKGAY